ncbi:Dormancy-associated protein-like protein 4 [Bienertia sinuspersici]
MSFLDKLWDETLAGPAPEKGVSSKLNKYKSSSAVRSQNDPIDDTRYHDDLDQTVGISRSITILRPKNLTVETGSGSESAASSPCTPTGPTSPFSLGERETMSMDPDVKRFTRARRKPIQHAESTSPTVYDWIMISALDR